MHTEYLFYMCNHAFIHSFVYLLLQTYHNAIMSLGNASQTQKGRLNDRVDRSENVVLDQRPAAT